MRPQNMSYNGVAMNHREYLFSVLMCALDMFLCFDLTFSFFLTTDVSWIMILAKTKLLILN